MGANEFDWSGNDVIVRPQGGVAAYLNENNDIVIRRQAEAEVEQFDRTIVIGRGFVRPLIERLERLLREGAGS
jgi:hypothetical protein